MSTYDKQNQSLVSHTSHLVSQDIVQLLKRVDSVILNCAGNAQMKTFNDGTYAVGESFEFHVPGVPPVTRGVKMDLGLNYTQRTLRIRADKDRWQFAVTNVFNQTDPLFYLNRKMLLETVSGPAVSSIKDKIEAEGIQYLKEHSPIIPTYGVSSTEPLTPTDSFDWDAINYLNKLRKDLIFSSGYKLVLNTRDDMALASNTTHLYSGDSLVSSAIKTGEPARNMSGFQNLCSPYISLHETLLSQTQKDNKNGYGVFFRELPTDENNNRGVLSFYKGATSHGSIKLRAGDIIYQAPGKGTTSFSVQDRSLNWIQGTTKTPIIDTRYSFCITSDAYVDRFRSIVAEGTKINKETGLPFSWRDFKYDYVRYRVEDKKHSAKIFLGYDKTVSPAVEVWDTETIKISFSHAVIPSGYHQNISESVVLDTQTDASKTTPAGTPDRFLVYGDHYKNFCVNKAYFQFYCFRLPPLHNQESSEVNDSRTGIKMRITKDSNLVERQNIFDVVTLPCFGAIAQNLFTLPTAAIQTTQGVSLVGKKKI